MAGKKTITARYGRKENLLAAFTRNGPRGVLFVETGRQPELAEQVLVVIEFPAEQRSFRLQGKVIARRRSSRESLPPGAHVEFLADENRTLQMVLDHAQGKAIDFIDRRGQRMPCSFVVSYRSDAGFVSEFAEDIGEGGTFIRTENIFEIGTEVECRLKPPGYLMGLKLKGRVAWVKKTGQPKGMGVEFIFRSERQRKKVREVVKKLVSEQTRQVKRKMKKIREADRFR
jgi:type IV pilus assembly protein PilZ